MTKEELITYRKDIITHIIIRLGDLDFQKSCWFKGEFFDIWASSLGEAINFLDDCDFFDNVDLGNIYFSDMIYQNKLLQFIKNLLTYEPLTEGEEILETPEWKVIALQAKELTTFLKEIKFK